MPLSSAYTVPVTSPKQAFIALSVTAAVVPCPEGLAKAGGIPVALTPPTIISLASKPEARKLPAPSTASGQPSLSESVSK